MVIAGPGVAQDSHYLPNHRNRQVPKALSTVSVSSTTAAATAMIVQVRLAYQAASKRHACLPLQHCPAARIGAEDWRQPAPATTSAAIVATIGGSRMQHAATSFEQRRLGHLRS